jgi:hypothetical protein
MNPPPPSDLDWIPMHAAPPPEGRACWTKIEDQNGTRNVQKLRRDKNLYWMPDGSMYVYYTPTHWAP